jgi:apolipoprotein D and lipocalin family protein
MIFQIRICVTELLIVGLFALLFFSCATPKELRTDHIPTVSSFDLNRYLGQWYEIARLPHKFEDGLDKVTATYTLQEDGEIQVINRGFRTEDDEWEEAEGKAWIPDPEKPALLRVSFFWIFASDYKIINLDQENYQYAMVTSSSKKYLWILSRTPRLEKDILQNLIDEATQLGFDIKQLYFVKHDS